MYPVRGYSGIEIERADGPAITARAVQKTNLARWLGRTDTRADSVVAALESHLDHAARRRAAY